MATRRTTETDEFSPRSHEDTWGASQPAKEAWEDKNADKVRKAVEAANEEKEIGDA